MIRFLLLAIAVTFVGCKPDPSAPTSNNTVTPASDAVALRVQREQFLEQRKRVEDSMRTLEQATTKALQDGDSLAARSTKQQWTQSSADLVEIQSKLDQTNHDLGTSVGTSLTEDQKMGMRKQFEDNIKSTEEELIQTQKNLESAIASDAPIQETSGLEVDIQYAEARIRVWRMLLQRLR